MSVDVRPPLCVVGAAASPSSTFLLLPLLHISPPFLTPHFSLRSLRTTITPLIDKVIEDAIRLGEEKAVAAAIEQV